MPAGGKSLAPAPSRRLTRSPPSVPLALAAGFFRTRPHKQPELVAGRSRFAVDGGEPGLHAIRQTPENTGKGQQPMNGTQSLTLRAVRSVLAGKHWDNMTSSERLLAMKTFTADAPLHARLHTATIAETVPAAELQAVNDWLAAQGR